MVGFHGGKIIYYNYLKDLHYVKMYEHTEFILNRMVFITKYDYLQKKLHVYFLSSLFDNKINKND